MKQCNIIISMLLIALILITAASCADKAETSSQAQTTSDAVSETSSEDTNSEEASSEPEAPGTPEEMAALAGTWETTWDIAEAFNEGMAEEPEMGEYVKIESFAVPLTFTFNTDGTYTLAIDKETLQSSLDAVREELGEGYAKYFEHLLESEAPGTTVEDYLASMEMTMDDLLDIAMLGFEFMGEMYDFTAEWKAEDGKLYLGYEDGEIDETEYITYELASGELTLKELFTENIFSIFSEDMFPMVLTKAE